jgi:hypothetical protein
MRDAKTNLRITEAFLGFCRIIRVPVRRSQVGVSGFTEDDDAPTESGKEKGTDRGKERSRKPPIFLCSEGGAGNV